jgi:2-aminoadipate transaminase
MTASSLPASAPAPAPGSWTLARRAARLEPSTIREILKVTERPGITSLAGGLPAAEGFPVEALREATSRVLREAPREALQYAASEGFGPLREWVAAHLAAQGIAATADRVLITSGSQQGLALAAQVLIDPGSVVAVEQPTYLGALQAFAPCEPEFSPLAADAEGVHPQALVAAREVGARFAYLLPNFQNPSGGQMSATRRGAVVEAATAAGLPIVEDNPYGELWYDAPPPPPLAAAGGQGVLHLGSFSKVLAPGLRLGYLLAPTALFPKLLQAKQAADLHTPGFNQRIVHAVLQGGFLDQHLPALRARYRERRDAMQRALERHFAGLPVRWQKPAGGMFFWLEGPPALDATALLANAVERGVAFVPGAPFYPPRAGHTPPANRLRLSFVTVSPERIEAAVAVLADVVAKALAAAPGGVR